MKQVPVGFKKAIKRKVSSSMAYAVCPDCDIRHESAAGVDWLPDFVVCPCLPHEKTEDVKKVFLGVELTEVQYTMLSWLATSAFNSETRKEPMLRGNVIAYENACRIVGVNAKLVYAVSVHLIFAGLQNMNKLTGIVLWD